jgi:Protein of unknown function (DUF3808)
VRPFFALDGSNVQAGVIAAESLITESQDVYGQSALFLFFRGRVERLKVNFPFSQHAWIYYYFLYFQSNVNQALMAYQAAVKASPQREVQLLCLHEVGWCHLILLHWSHAHVSFLRLKKESRWSKGFYAYLAAGIFVLCYASFLFAAIFCGQCAEALLVMREGQFNS